jgi:hypothetical protein
VNPKARPAPTTGRGTGTSVVNLRTGAEVEAISNVPFRVPNVASLNRGGVVKLKVPGPAWENEEPPMAVPEVFPPTPTRLRPVKN